MAQTLRTLLLRSAGAAALLAAGSAAASAQTVNGGGSTLATAPYEAIISDLAPLGTVTYTYTSSGSSAAQTAFLNNEISAFGTGAPTSGNVDFGASDATLSSAQIASFTGTKLIQLPTIGTPITLPFHMNSTLGTDGGVNLTNAEVCGIFSAKLTNWSQVSGVTGMSGQIKVAFRSDGSGTSFLFTQHLAATCNTTNSAFTTATTTSGGFSATTTFANLPFPGGTLPSNFTSASGTPGVAAAIMGTTNSIGYLSPDATQISPDNNGLTTVPPVASIGSVLPDEPHTTTALTEAVTLLGSSSAPTGTDASNPMNWVPAAPAPTAGYPIVGYTTWEVTGCYASSAVGAGVAVILDNLYNAPGAAEPSVVAGEVTSRGFVVVPTAFASSIVSTFLTSGSTLAINTTTNCSGGR
jgi:phosphate transport system substrate-binding protein